MSAAMIPFNFNGHELRAIKDVNGEPWFVAKDVAEVLEYSDAEAMTRKLDDDEKQNLQIVGFGPRGVNVINESGLYACILTSKKPEAKRFKRWVTHDVLPTIRKTGSYSAAKTTPPAAAGVETLSTASQVFTALFTVSSLVFPDRNQALLSADGATLRSTGVSMLSQLDVKLLAPAQELTFTPTELGKLMKPPISGQAFNKLLEQAGLQARLLNEWVPTSAAAGLYEIIDTSKRHKTDGAPVKQVKWRKIAMDKVCITPQHGPQTELPIEHQQEEL
jgi:prophage antirepressor-like protein